MQIIKLLLLMLLFIACKSSEKRPSVNITIPSNLSVYIDGVDTVVHQIKSENTLLVFYDERDCLQCDYGSLILLSKYFTYSKKNPDKLSVKIIFSIRDRKRIEEFEDYSLIYTLGYPIFLDTLGEFRRINPYPELDKMATTFLLNASDSVLATNIYTKKGEERIFADKLRKLIE